MPGLSLYGTDLRSIGAYLQGIPTFASPPGSKTLAATIPAAHGAFLASRTALGARVLPVRLALVRDSVATRLTLESQVKRLCEGLVRLTLDLGGGVIRRTDGVLEGEPVWRHERPFRQPVAFCELSFLCPDPFWRDAMSAPVAIPATATRYALPLGDASVAPIINVQNGATPQVTLRDAWGAIRHQLTLPTLGASEWLQLHGGYRTAVKYTSSGGAPGAGTNAMPNLTFNAGTWPLVLASTYADYANSRWPTVELSAGQGEVLFARRWL